MLKLLSHFCASTAECVGPLSRRFIIIYIKATWPRLPYDRDGIVLFHLKIHHHFLSKQSAGAISTRTSVSKHVVSSYLPHLNEGSPAQSGFDQRLGDPASGVRSGPIHFGVIFPGEGSSSVATPASIRIHDDFTPCESCVTLVIRKHRSTPALTHSWFIAFSFITFPSGGSSSLTCGPPQRNFPLGSRW